MLKKKEIYSRKFLYKVPRDSKNYIAIFKNTSNINLISEYIIIKCKNLYSYLCNHKQDKLFLLKYFELHNKSVNMSFFNDRYENSDQYYIIDHPIEDLYTAIETTFNVKRIDYKLNRKNNCISCDKCIFKPQCNEDIFIHYRNCKTYRYTLFGEEPPKALLKKEKQNVNITVNNTTYNYNISFRATGDFIRDKLSDSEKLMILQSRDKVGLMVEEHFKHPEIKGNIIIKNTSPYSTCRVFDGNDFTIKKNQDIFKYYIFDHLDSLDYMAFDLKNDRISRNLEKYDNNIRNDEKRLRDMIAKTILQVKDLSCS